MNTTAKQSLKTRIAGTSSDAIKQIAHKLKDETASQGCFSWTCAGGKYHGHGVSKKQSK